MKIVDIHDRSVLGEGRNYGMGFAFCIQKAKDEFHTVMPITACKDYLNDVIFVEKTGIQLPSVYGFEHKPVGCIGDKYSYIASKILHYNGGAPYKNFDLETEGLKANYKIIKKALNQIEEQLEIGKTTIKLVDDTILMKVPSWWCSEGWRLSYYMFITRNLIFCTEQEDPITHLLEKSSEKYIMKSIIDKFNEIINLKKENQLDKIVTGLETVNSDNVHTYKSIVHNCGISNIKIT